MCGVASRARWFARARREGSLESASILIVEDDPLSGRTLAAILRYYGHAVEVVTSVSAGLERLRSQPRPQCVLLDLMLPDGDGALILVWLRAARSRIPVAVVSSVVDDQRSAMLLGLGADRVMAKPVNPNELLDWLERVAANPSDQTVRPPDDLPGMHLQ